ncbi:ribonuclease III [Hydrogenophaga aquatica]
MKPELLALQERLGHRFADLRLLERALTHRSFSADHYERLEFLGDSVLSLAVSGLLYERLSSQPEGDLSRIRANLVKQDTLHGLADVLKLAPLLRLGEGEIRSGGRERPSILADALEAILGAVYLDAGFDAANALVRRLYQSVDLSPGQSVQGKDAKTALQEWLQGRKMKLPAYRVAATTGEAHRQTFEVVCQIETGHEERGSGASRRAAEQAAAAAMLQYLKSRKP